MTPPMTRFDAIPGGRPCGAFRPNDARIEQVASTGSHSTASVVGKPKTSNTSGKRKWSIATMAPARALSV